MQTEDAIQKKLAELQKLHSNIHSQAEAFRKAVENKDMQKAEELIVYQLVEQEQEVNVTSLEQGYASMIEILKWVLELT